MPDERRLRVPARRSDLITLCRSENAEIYRKYKELADSTPGVHFVGRLATYKYYNMDQVVAQALTLYSKIIGVRRAEAVTARADEPRKSRVALTAVASAGGRG